MRVRVHIIYIKVGEIQIKLEYLTLHSTRLTEPYIAEDQMRGRECMIGQFTCFLFQLVKTERVASG